MPCYSPLKGYRFIKNGEKSFSLKLKVAQNFNYELSEVSCQQCIGCKIQRSKDWAIRCVNEIHYHEHNMFITLTYSPENLPSDGSLQKEHLQLFFKRYRKFLSAKNKKIRYYACGEYGENKQRPHYHALIFGHEFDDRELLFHSKGNPIYKSKQLSKLWTYGISSIGEANIGTAAYISKYVTKKYNGDLAKETYFNVDQDTGECLPIIPEFTVMSTVPGIGGKWLDEYHPTELYKGYITHEGVKFRIPRYYMDRLEKHDPILHKIIKEKTTDRMEDIEKDSYERLLAREYHAHLIINQEMRNLEND